MDTDIGLYAGTSYPRSKSKKEEYFDRLIFAYYDNEHILCVRRIRNAKSEREAIKIYYKGLKDSKLPVDDKSFRFLSVEKQNIMIKDMQKFLSRKGVRYPAERRK